MSTAGMNMKSPGKSRCLSFCRKGSWELVVSLGEKKSIRMMAVMAPRGRLM